MVGYRWGDLVAVGFLLAVCGFLSLAVDYSGDFAINDDWGYSTPVFWWVERSGFHLTNWQSMPLLPQLGLGIIWAEVFGASQESLRLLTLGFALCACLSVYGLARLLGVAVPPSLLAAMLPLASPIFLGLSFTFMTDIPATALTLLSLVFFTRLFARPPGRIGDFWLGLGFLVLAVLLRQTSFGIALAFAIVFLATNGFRPRKLALSAVIVVLPVVAYLGATSGLEATTGLPFVYHAKTEGLVLFFQGLLAGNAGVLVQSAMALLRLSAFCGLFLLPLLPLFWAERPRALWRLALLVLLALGLTFGAISLGGEVFAVRGDFLTINGVGPRLIAGVEDKAPLWLSAALTFVGHLVTLFALVICARSLGGRGAGPGTPKPALVFLLLAAFIGFGPHMSAFAPVFDRYTLLPAILLALVTLAALPQNRDTPQGLFPGFALALVVFLTSISLTRDFFAWQDARYALISRLVGNMGASVQEIDGGFEFNNLNAIRAQPQIAVGMAIVDPSARPIRLSASAGAGDRVLDRITYGQFLGLKEGTIYALGK